MIKEKINMYIDLWEFEGKIANVIVKLDNLRKEAEKLGYNNITIDINIGGSSEISLQGERLETDIELKQRTRKTQQQRARRKKEVVLAKKKRRENYLKLKKEFGGD